MKMTLRWFGEGSDPVPLAYIRQIPGVTGIMGVLDAKAPGEVWEEDEIARYIAHVNASGLACEVIESVNVHEDIKMGVPARDARIDAYIRTLRNLAKHGVKVVIYNFMPVLDWLRTDLARLIPEDGSNGFYYDEKDLGALTPMELVKKTSREAHGFSLPGWEPERMALLSETLACYEGMTKDDLFANYRYFLDAVIPVCENAGIKLACHPDDPAWPIFGLPRLAGSREDLDRIVALRNSACNTLCLCTGSLGSNPANDIPAIIRHFGRMSRIGAVHARNVKHLGYHHFRETSHLSADGDIDMYAVMRAVRDACPKVYLRPDHGRNIFGEEGRPGYGLYDRALGAAYLNGLWEALGKENAE